MEDQISKILFDPIISKIVTIAILSLVIIAISRFFKSRSANVKNIDKRYKLRKVISLLTYFLIILMVSIVFSDKLGGLTVALGVAGAGIAFALQEVIASVAGWLAISFSNFYKVGDRVKLGGSIGDVIDIGILRTTLMECGEWVQGDQYTGRIVRIANSFVFKDSVINYSGDFAFLWDEIKIPIRYGSDITLAKDIFKRAAQESIAHHIPTAKKEWDEMKVKFRIEDASVEPFIFMIANDNWLEFSLRYVVDFRERRSTKSKLFTFILNEINKTDGKVQFASATFELVATPIINVKNNV